jgi:flagellar biosynthesis anti-sigma factor FlgM
MRIDGFSQRWIDSNASKLERQDRAGSGTNRLGGLPEKRVQQDEYRISVAGADAQEINRERVEQLSAQIASGTYQVEADVVADAMLKTFGH